jgi:hypothetical protein
VSNRVDGRSSGTSSRSFHPGALAIVSFQGTGVKLYGVLGKKGGFADVWVDRRFAGKRIDFYAPRVETNVLVYESPRLRYGVHTLALRVAAAREPHGGAYANIDRVVFLKQ